MFFYSEPTDLVPLTLLSSTSSLSFASTYIGQTEQKTFTITATGNTTETINLSDDSDQYDFSPSSFTLSNNSSQLITVTFAPTSAGSKTAVLTLSSSGGNITYVSLTGSSVNLPFVLNTSTSSLTFAGNTAVGSTSTGSIQIWGSSTGATETVTITDNSPNFSATTSSLVVIGDGGSTKQTVNLQFTPTAIGLLTGTLTLSSSGGSIKTVDLTGSGIDQYFNNTSLLLKGNGTSSSPIIDSSANNFTVTKNGFTFIDTTDSMYGGSSIYFNGNGSYLTTTNNSKFQVGSSNFTIEMWVKAWTLGTNGSTRQLFGKRSTSSAQTGPYALLQYSTATGKNNLQFTAWTGVGQSVVLTGPSSIPTNTWVHLAFVRNGNVWSSYVNGTLYATANSSATVTNDTAPFSIGSTFNGSPGSSAFYGFIDDFRFTQGVARYTESFTVPGAL